MISDLKSGLELAKTIEKKEEATQKRLKKMADFELSTMYLESFCDFSLFFENGRPLIYERDYDLNLFRQVAVSQIRKKLKNCR